MLSYIFDITYQTCLCVYDIIYNKMQQPTIQQEHHQRHPATHSQPKQTQVQLSENVIRTLEKLLKYKQIKSNNTSSNVELDLKEKEQIDKIEQKKEKLFTKIIGDYCKDKPKQQQSHLYKSKQDKIEDNDKSVICNELLQLRELLNKQTYPYDKIQQQLNQLLSSTQQKQQQLTSIWTIQTSYQQSSLLWYNHLLHKIQVQLQKQQQKFLKQQQRQSIQIGKQIENIIINGWLYTRSRQFMVKYIVACITAHNINKHDGHDPSSQEEKLKMWRDNEGIWGIVRVIEQWVMGKVKGCEQAKMDEEMAVRDWVVLHQLYIIHNKQYRKYKIERTMVKQRHNRQEKQLNELIWKLSPSQVEYMASISEDIEVQDNNANKNMLELLKQLHSIEAELKKQSENEVVVQYEQKKKNMIESYMSQEIKVIKQELVNNSYPSHYTIIHSYITITNLIHILTNYYSHHLDHNKVISNLANQVFKATHKLIRQLHIQQKRDENNSCISVIDILAILTCKSRIKIIKKMVTHREKITEQFGLLAALPMLAAIRQQRQMAEAHTFKCLYKLIEVTSKSVYQPFQQYYIQQLRMQVLLYLGRTNFISDQDNQDNLRLLTRQLIQPILSESSIKFHRITFVLPKFWGLVVLLSAKSNGNLSLIAAFINLLLQQINKEQKMISYLIQETVEKNVQPTTMFKYWQTTATACTHLNITMASHSVHLQKNNQAFSNIIDHHCLQPIFALLSPSSQNISLSLMPLIQALFTANKVKPLHNLFQLENVSIKFHQINEHNKCKQTVFQSDIYRNHIASFIGIQAVQIWIKADYFQTCQKQIFSYVMDSLEYIKKAQHKLTHNSAAFYQILSTWKLLHTLFCNSGICRTLLSLSIQNQKCLLLELLQIAETGYIHPLVRQYISVIMGKLYQSVSKHYHGMDLYQQWRKVFINRISSDNVDINVWVPIIFNLGYEMLYLQTIVAVSENNKMQIIGRIEQTMSLFMKYISCHHAYIRSIVQYYIKKKITSEGNTTESQPSFLHNLCFNIWVNDKDCIKIMRNIGIAVEGFKEAMENEDGLQFLGYERVEEYPGLISTRQMRLDLIEVFSKIVKNNDKKLKESKNKEYEEYSKHLIVINKLLGEKIRKQTIKVNSECSTVPLVLHYKQPQLIIIATLLEKVHNFGYILRTLHQTPSLLLVPSRQPLEHPQCKQFIPANSQVQIIEIKQSELTDFVRVAKKIGYPLIGLQQCAGSIRVQENVFPNKYMLLLGNQRIGAPAHLLNLADVLVQIQQVGKVRSLNVHVSMAVCLWEAIRSKDKKSKQKTVL